MILTTGINEISRDKFVSARLLEYDLRNKPIGGLWGSTFIEKDKLEDDLCYAPSDWVDFCVSDRYRLNQNRFGIIYNLKESARIYEVDSIESYLNLMEQYPYHIEKLGKISIGKWC